jgi:hypothetical protein
MVAADGLHAGRVSAVRQPDSRRRRIVSCLRQNTDLLSRNCRAVFEANASMPNPPQGSPAPPNGGLGGSPPH